MRTRQVAYRLWASAGQTSRSEMSKLRKALTIAGVTALTTF